MPEISAATQDKKPSKKRLIALIATLTISFTIIWFIFGWLYGPRPNPGTLPKFITSYFSRNSQPDSGEELVSAGGDLEFLRVPRGFKISIFAENLGGPNLYIPGVNWGLRQMAPKAVPSQDSQDNSKAETGDQKTMIYATIHKEGKVVAIQDSDKDGKADKSVVFLENLSLPHGIEVYQDWIYVAENDKLIRVKDVDTDGRPDGAVEKVLDLPPLLEHWTRTVRIMPDPAENSQNNYIFVSIGSSCNSCLESNPWRAAIIKCELDGKNCNPYASGLRNAVDFTLYQNQIWATETGKDFLGNDLPPEEVNIIKKGKNYGWPQCYGKQVWDQSFDTTKNSCDQTEPSFSELPPHSTAIGITGYSGSKFGPEYQNKLFVALHGSWQSSPPTGFQIVMVDPETGQNKVVVDGFAPDNKTYGRPVHILNYRGGLLISDDMGGKIYFLEAQQ